MSFFTNDKVSGAWAVYFLKKQLKDQEEENIIGQFLWSNGLGDWSANLKQGPSWVRIRGAVE